MHKYYHNYYGLVKKMATVSVVLFFLFFANNAQAAIPNDPNFGDQMSMWRQIGAPFAWDFTTGSKRVVLAVIDTGADIWNNDLKSNIWTNPYEIPGNNYDDDNDGYVDDVHGWNFIEDNNDVRTSVFDSTDDPEAVNHGTIIAGLIGAVGNNNQDGLGLNWQISIMPLRAVASDGSGSYVKVAKAIEYAVNHGADVISLSIVGNQYDEGLKQVLYQAYKKGVVIVAAAGNGRKRSGEGDLSKTPNYPVCFDTGDKENWLIGVSSVDSGDNLSKFSDFGPCVDILAPGQNIFSTQRYAPVYGYNEEFGGPWQGTSFATPLVAGAAALLKAQRPDWSAPQIIAALLNNADNVDSQNPEFKNKLGFGRLNIGKAMTFASQANFPASYLPWLDYRVKDKVIYTLENGKKYFFADTGDASIVSVVATRSFDNKRDEVYALVKRGKNYFVQFFTDSGRKWQEKAVPLGDYANANLPIKILVVNNSDNRKIQINFSQKITQKIKVGKKIVTKTSVKNTTKYYDWLQ